MTVHDSAFIRPTSSSMRARATAPQLDDVIRNYTGMVQGALAKLGVESSALEDASQEVFLVLARRFAEYDPQRSVASWLWGIARGVASTHRRSARRRHRLHAAVATVEPSMPPGPEDAAAASEARRMMDAFLGSLDEDKCAVFVLAELEGRSGPEIAARLDVNLNTVYARMRAARRRFDEAVAQHRSGAARLSAIFGLQLGGRATAASLSTAFASMLVVPAMALGPRPAPPVAVPAVVQDEPTMNVLGPARNVVPVAKVAVEPPDEPMPKILPTLAVATTLAAPSLALAKEPPAKTAPVVTDQDADAAAMLDGSTETREYIFGDETLDGDVNRPGGENIHSRARVRHQSLIRIRGHFIRELIVLGTDI
ncbi:MAG: sigma-70 family RNA polymerase sigma factor [Myxococcota bacterium]